MLRKHDAAGLSMQISLKTAHSLTSTLNCMNGSGKIVKELSSASIWAAKETALSSTNAKNIEISEEIIAIVNGTNHLWLYAQ